MSTKLNISTENQIRRKLEKLLSEGRFAEANKVMREYDRLRAIKKEFSCSEITNQMPEEHKQLANLYLRKICILSDIVEGTGIDMLALLKQYDPYLELPLIALLENLQRTAREINKIIDATGDYEYRASFGDVCDEIDKRIKDLFEKREI